ncbi:MAG: phosphoglycerate kinase [Deltaproteobacteria bacterium]|nr:phosphoglycerate kinase [Deltaproteobacteria bacterium]
MPLHYFNHIIKTVDELPIHEGDRVFLRCDFNVPLDKNRNILDDTRIRASLPTIQYLLDKKSKLILASHLGRPKDAPAQEFSLEPVGRRLSELLKKDVIVADDCIGEGIQKVLEDVGPEQILLLENLRFNSGEKKNNPAFAHHMSLFVDVYVNDAFGVSHRSDASVEALPHLIKRRGCGFLIQKEVENLTRVLEHPERPYVAIIGGSKVSDKIGLLRNLMVKADIVLVGGALAYTLLKAKGVEVGDSLVEDEKLQLAKNLFEKAVQEKVELVLPCDHIVKKENEKDSEYIMTENQNIQKGFCGVDIGPKTISKFSYYISRAKTIFWNGPLGIYEKPPYDAGTRAIAQLVGESSVYSIVGGGDCVAAVAQAGVLHKISHISTGGGASLEFLEGKILPGLMSLKS